MSGNKKIFIAGHNGMVGSSILRNLDKNNIIIIKVNYIFVLKNKVR